MILPLALVKDFHAWSPAHTLLPSVFPPEILARLKGFGSGDAIETAWVAFGLYWLIAARGRNAAQRREPAGELLIRVVWMIGAAYLLFHFDPRFGALNRRF
ncbi:MAG: hypothetical protein ACRD4M_03540, partial [Candidatus Acidiferrales bacterium]